MATTKRIHVNQHIIKRNRNFPSPQHEPPLTVKTYKENTLGFKVDIKGESTLVYSPNKPLSCGARLWIETQAPVVVDGKWIF